MSSARPCSRRSWKNCFSVILLSGSLRQVTNLHAAVWLSAAMFAVAHVYAPLGIPWLLVAGVVFGYSRDAGGLPLAILMHFTHNLAVLCIEGAV